MSGQGQPRNTRRIIPGQDTNPPGPKPKHGYFPAAELTDDHPCAPSLIPLPILNPPNKDLQFAGLQPPNNLEHHGLSPAWEHPAPAPAPTKFRTTHAELTCLSSRPYSLRVSDPSDFASTWEATIVPLLSSILQQHCTGDYAVDVHNFPETPSEAVPRVIYITIADSEAEGPSTGQEQLEQAIRSELARAVPERFGPVQVKFWRGGGLRRSNWWGEGNGQIDTTCEPKNIAYRTTPIMGISIGPMRVRGAASLGGFIKVGPDLYAMSAFHAFEDSIMGGHSRVCHPAEMDVSLLPAQNSQVRPYNIGTVSMWRPLGTLRPSLTFDGMGLGPEETMVEMDWCLIGPVANGKNFVSVPNIQMDRSVAVENTAAVEGNTEVYAIARTSGYSLGFTSDVPGLLRINGRRQREWTVRQYSPFQHPKDGQANAPWQTLEQWVTSGIGVPGDSGAWLMRRSDNALMGLIWARNHNSGNPLKRVRLAYFTPMVDILADVRQNYAGEETVTLPSYSTADLTRAVDVRRPQDVVQVGMSQDPWSSVARDEIGRYRETQANLIRSHFVDEGVPESGTVLERRQDTPFINDLSTNDSEILGVMGSSAAVADPRTTPSRPRSHSGRTISTLRSQNELLLGIGRNDSSLPGLSSSPSIRSNSSVVGDGSEVASMGDNVRIIGEGDLDLDITNAEEPVRAKAIQSPSVRGLGGLITSPRESSLHQIPKRGKWLVGQSAVLMTA